MREGFYAIFYTGAQGSGTILLCMKAGRLVGVDALGGQISGDYQEQDHAVQLNMVFQFAPGPMVTGQFLTEPLRIERALSISTNVLEGEIAKVDLGLGPVNVRGQFVADPI